MTGHQPHNKDHGELGTEGLAGEGDAEPESFLSVVLGNDVDLAAESVFNVSVESPFVAEGEATEDVGHGAGVAGF